MRRILGPFGRLMAGMTMGQKIGLLFVVGSAVAGLVVVGLWVRQPDYQLLFGNLTSDGAFEVIERLKAEKIPYKMGNGGRDIMVPTEKIYETRIALAGEGLPQGGQLGFELFDRSRLGMGNFTQQIYFQRALQGELGRTISSLSGVEQARVHLVMKSQSVFENEENQPSASVALKLKPSVRLGREQIQSIVHLVAGSVQGLSPDRVVVVDQQGTLLSGGEKDSGGGLVSSSQFEQQHLLETQMEKSVQGMLEQALGPEKAIVRVSLDMDFTKVEEMEEKFDPENLTIRSEQRTTERSEGSDQRGAAAAGQQAAGKSSTSTKQNETINYEVNKVTRRLVEPSGKVKRLSVAVMVDGRYEAPAGGGEPVYTPRTDEELKTYEGLVKDAVGFDTARGDRVTVVNVAFRRAEQGFAPEEGASVEKLMKRHYWIGVAQKVLAVLLIPVLLIFMVLRPLLKWVTSASPAPAGGTPGAYQLPRTVEQLEAEMGLLPGARAGESPYRLKAAELAKSDPSRAAQLAKSWLKQ